MLKKGVTALLVAASSGLVAASSTLPTAPTTNFVWSSLDVSRLPEPVALLLLGVGLIALSSRGRRQAR